MPYVSTMQELKTSLLPAPTWVLGYPGDGQAHAVGLSKECRALRNQQSQVSSWS